MQFHITPAESSDPFDEGGSVVAGLNLPRRPKFSAPAQFVGHVMTPEQLRSLPDSPTFKVHMKSDARVETRSVSDNGCEQTCRPRLDDGS